MIGIHLLLLLLLPSIELCRAQACTRSSVGSVRLVGGANSREGRVEFCFEDQWGTVCNNTFRSTEASVVCRELGFSTSGAVVLPASQTTPGSGPIWLDRVICSGTESQLNSCFANRNGFHACTHAQDVGIRCMPMPDTDSESDGLSSAQVTGITVGIVFASISITSFVAIICYKMKGSCRKSEQYSNSVTFITQSNTSLTDSGHYIPPRTTTFSTPTLDSPARTQRTPHTQLQNIEELSHSEASTYEGEAPPAYHTVEQYRTMAEESYRNYSLLNSSQNDNPSAPPAYS